MRRVVRGALGRFAGLRIAGILLLCSMVTSWAPIAAAVGLPSTYPGCANRSVTVPWGGTVNVNLTTCHFFGLGLVSTAPTHGTATPGDPAPIDTYNYNHNGSTPAGGGTDTFVVLDDNSDFITVTVTIQPPSSPITVTPASLPALSAGTPFSQTLTSAGGLAPYTYTLQSGTLPLGLSLSSAGVISGTPTQRGGYGFTVRSTDSTSPTAQFTDRGYSGTVNPAPLSITPASATAIQSVPFSQTLAITGGVAPHSCLLETGAFPAGISISSGCVISGTTTAAAGNYPVTIRVSDSSTGVGTHFELESFTLTVSPPPSVSIAVSPAWVSEDGATNLTYTVTRSLNLSSPTTVSLAIGGTATNGADYATIANTVVIPSGATTASVVVDPTVDGTVEADESVILTVIAGTGYTVGVPASATGTILNDDVPSATISVTPANVAEDGAPNLVFTVTLNQANPGAATSIGYTIGGTATNSTDYATITSPLVIPAGNLTGTITVNPTADAAIEADETVTLTLAAGAGYTVGAPASATGTILDDDLPNLTINDVTVSEGNAGTTNFTFTVSLSAPAGPGGVSFDIATANDSATAGVDYVASTLTSQTIPAASSSYTFTVQVNGDTQNEATETYFVNATNVVNAVVADSQGVGTITNDDPLPSLSINDVTLAEDDSGTSNAVFTATLSAASGQSVSVNYATGDGTATQPEDYTNTSGTLTFAPGQTTRTITVPVIGEIVPEANETFFVNLSGAVNATISDNQGVGTITNDDVPVTVNPASVPNGTVAAAYSQTLTASDGTGPYSFSVTAGALPAGLTLSPGGVLSGTPTAGGTFNFTATATDSSLFPGPFSGGRAYSLVIAPPTISLPATTLAGGAPGSSYSASITAASGGTAPYSYAVAAGALPNGLTLNPSTGAITGTPSAMGTFNFSITATDSSTGTGPYTATQAYAISVIDVPPVANPVSLSVAYNAAATNVPLNITGGAPTSVAIATPPSNGTAIVSGTTITYQPTTGYAGPDSFSYTASNGGGTSAPATVSITVQDPVITITASGGFAATVAAPYTQTFTFNGGAQPWSSFQVSNLPAGVSITGTTANTVTISGTPTQAGSFNLNVSASDSSAGNGPYVVGQAFSLTVASPTLAMTPAPGTLNAPYATSFTQAFIASGGSGPYSYAITGALPTGLSFSAGTISGSPTVSGNYPITITATDTGSTGAGAPFTIARNYTINVPSPVIAVNPATLPNTIAGQTYTQTLTATGGASPYAFAVSAGSLPSGLTLASGGALSGTTTTSGTFNFTVTATDHFGQTGSRAYTVVVAVPTITLTPATLPGGTAGTAYSQALTAGGGIAPYTVSQTGTLPTGLVFNSATRTFSGTPTQSGSFPITVTATDSTGGTAATVTSTYTLAITAPTLTMTPAAGALLAATAGSPYSQTFTANNGIAPYAYVLSAGALPAGLTLNPGTGALSGTPTVAGTFNFSVTATDSTTGTAGTVTNAYTLTLSAPTITINPATLPNGIFSVPYHQALTAVAGNAPYTFAISAGALPAGVTLSSDGALSGSPTVSGTFNFTVRATDALGFRGTRDFTFAVAERSDPSRDPEFRGIVDAQAEATRRFATSQSSNFQQRLEQLHRGGNGGFENGIALASPSPCATPNVGARAIGPCESNRSGTGSLGAIAPEANAAAPSNSNHDTPWGVWVGGTLRSGSQDGRNGSADITFETDGLSLGIDYRINDGFVIGAGIGYGKDQNEIGERGSRLLGEADTLAVYASHHPGDLFVDVLLGYQRLDFDLRRFVAVNGNLVRGRREGTQWFSSIALGRDFTSDVRTLTPYARIDATRANLYGYSESGDPVFAFRFDPMSVDSTSGNLGLRAEWQYARDWGRFSPQLRFEYQHDFSSRADASLRYADLPLGTLYGIQASAFDQRRVQIGLGLRFNLDTGWNWQLDYRGLLGGDGDTDNAFGISVQKSL